MLDINLIRKNPDKIRKAIKDKNGDPGIIDKWLEKDKERSQFLVQIDQLRAERNRLTEEFKKTRPTPQKAAEAKEMRREIQKLEKEAEEINREWQNLLLQIPNPPKEDVPVGKEESENVEIKRWDGGKKFDFSPQDYLTLAEKLDLIDVERAAKVSGSRFGYLKNEAVLLEFALVQFAFDTLTKEGFIPVVPPVMVKKEIEIGLGYADEGWKEMYVLNKDNLVLVATAEHSLVAMHKDEIFSSQDLPKRYVGFSTCFRREAGSYGKDTRGILRVHQFDKVEMVSFTLPEKSDEEHNYLVGLEEKLVQSLKLSYRLVKVCTGDLGVPAARKYDIEIWLPSEKKYRETHSCSNCTDFQARRLNIRYKTNKGTNFVHILNGTAFAIGRMTAMILENYQQKDGSIAIPEVLQKYVGKKKIERKSS